MSNKIVVVIPTYNEKDNIVEMIKQLNALNLSIDILVVDDTSPDRTGDVVESVKEATPNVDIIHRKKKEGIGPAYIEAFGYLLKKDEHDYIIEMDADFSHNPKDIPRLLAAAGQYDAVVGSRYVKGGAVSDKWSRSRKFISSAGNLYARIITGLPVKDCTAGFKCYRKSALKLLDFSRIFLNGYSFQVQILFELKKKGLSIGEIPIFFDERTEGKSKMDLNIMLEAFFSLPLMRIRDLFGGVK